MATIYHTTIAPPTAQIFGPFRGGWTRTLPGERTHSQIQWCFALDQSAAFGGGIADSGLEVSIPSFTEEDEVLHKVMLWRGCTPPLQSQTISGTVNICIGCRRIVGAGTPATISLRLHIFVGVGNTSTVRGVLLNNYVSVKTWSTSGTFLDLAATQTLSPVQVEPGDRMIVEIGPDFTANPVGDTTARMWFGSSVGATGAAYPDGVVGASDLNTKAGHIDFSHTFLEQAAAAAPANDACVDAMPISIPFDGGGWDVSQSADGNNGGKTFSHGVWFQFTAPETGALIINTMRSNYATRISTWDDPCGAFSAFPEPDFGEQAAFWIGRSQTLISLRVTAGTVYRMHVGKNHHAQRPGQLFLNIDYAQARQPGDLYIVAQHILAVREGKIINFNSNFYGLAPAGPVIDYTHRAMPDLTNDDAVHTGLRLAFQLVGTGGLIEFLDLVTLNREDSGELNFADLNDADPTIDAMDFPLNMVMHSDGDYILAGAGDNYNEQGTPPSDPLSAWPRRFGLADVENPTLEAMYQVRFGQSGPEQLMLSFDETILYYTSADQILRAFDIINNVQLPDVATVPSPGGARPGLRGLHLHRNGNAFIANGQNVVEVALTGAALSYPHSSVVIVDSGQGTNEDPLSQGGAWVHPLAWWGAGSTMRRFGNSLKTNLTTRVGAAMRTTAVGLSTDVLDVYFLVDVVGVSVGDFVGLEIYQTSTVGSATGLNGYNFWVEKIGTASWVYSLEKATNDVFTNLTFRTDLILEAGDVIGIRRDPSNPHISVFRLHAGVWTEILTAADNSHLGPWFITLGMDDTATGVSTWQIRDFGAGAFAPGTPSPGGAVVRTLGPFTSPTFGQAEDLDKTWFSPDFTILFATDQLTTEIFKVDLATGAILAVWDLSLPTGQLCGFVPDSTPIPRITEPNEPPEPNEPNGETPCIDKVPCEPEPTDPDEPVPSEGFDYNCEGGGLVPSYPTAEQPSMAGVREPRTWARIAFVNDLSAGDILLAVDDPQNWAQDATIPDPPEYLEGLKPGRLSQIDPITRGLSDEDGNYAGSRTKLNLNDKDRSVLRLRMQEEVTKWVWNREGSVYINSEERRRAQLEPRELFRGITQEIACTNGFNASIGFEDKLLSQFGRFSPDQTFSRRVFPKAMLAGLPAQLAGLPVQIIMGEVSDKGAVRPGTGEDAAKGMVPVWHIGARSFGGTIYDEYHIAGHAIKAWELYGSDDGVNSEDGNHLRRVLQDLNALGGAGDVLGPYYAGWPLTTTYLDLLNPLDVGGDGRIHRVTHFFVRHDHFLSIHHKQGLIRMAANVCGVEDVGNGDGNLITDLYKQYHWLFEHVILPQLEYHTGLYHQAPPAWADGRIMIESESFEEAQDLSIRRIGGTGYRGDFVFCGPGEGALALREALRRFSISGDCKFTWSGAGQLKCVTFDNTTFLDTKPIWREPLMIRSWPSPRFAHEEVENPVLYSYDYDDDAKAFRSADRRVHDSDAIRKYGMESPSKRGVEMRCIRDEITALDVANRRLFKRKYPPAYYPITTPLDGVDFNPGDIVRVQSQEGVSTIPGDISPTVETPIQIQDTTYNPKTKTCEMVGLGVEGLMADFVELEDFPTVFLVDDVSNPDTVELV